jgi:hypothetical protein
MKTILRSHKTPALVPKQKPEYDPAEDLFPVPPPFLHLEQQAVAEKN